MELLGQKVLHYSFSIYSSLAFQKFVPTFTDINSAGDTDSLTALTLYPFVFSLPCSPKFWRFALQHPIEYTESANQE